MIYMLATQITEGHTEHSHENRQFSLGKAARVLQRDNVTSFGCKLLFRNYSRLQKQAIQKL